jgi:hypothetical protein
MRLAAALAAMTVMTGAGLAQPSSRPVENVTVTGTRDRQVLEKFVQTFAAPARISGKLVRWQDGICPVTVGLKPQFAQFITQHLKDVAAQAGAPVNNRAGCKPNIEIVFTTTPQALADRMRRQHRDFLGYHDSRAQADALAKVTNPIQAWYTTATRDLRGKQVLDSARLQGTGDTPAAGSGMSSMIWSSAEVTGARIGDGKSGAFYHVIIAAEPARLEQYEIGTLADYIAMMALTQLNSLDVCQPLASIINLLAPGCEHTAAQMTASDMAFLKGLYRMTIGRNRAAQEDEVVFRMQSDGK